MVPNIGSVCSLIMFTPCSLFTFQRIPQITLKDLLSLNIHNKTMLSEIQSGKDKILHLRAHDKAKPGTGERVHVEKERDGFG